MQDKLGIDLNKGDLVVYAKGAQSDDHLYLATIESVDINKSNCVTIYTHDTKRKLTRNPANLINVGGLKHSNPEAFI